MTNHFDTVLSRLQMLISGIADAALEEELKQLLNHTKLACFEHCWTSERATLQEYAINELVIMGKSDSPSCVPQVRSSNQPRVLPTECLQEVFFARLDQMQIFDQLFGASQPCL